MLANLFEDLKGRKRVGRKRWQSILGQLRFVSVAIPGSAGLFSALQLALNNAEQNRVKITKHLRRHIHNVTLSSRALQSPRRKATPCDCGKLILCITSRSSFCARASFSSFKKGMFFFETMVVQDSTYYAIIKKASNRSAGKVHRLHR